MRQRHAFGATRKGKKAGSIADAAVQLSGVFQAAQEAADSYLKSIKAKEKELARLTKQAKKNMRD